VAGGQCLGIILVSGANLFWSCPSGSLVGVMTSFHFSVVCVFSFFLVCLAYNNDFHIDLQPFIEELNYPMTRDCSAGRTSIYVNGRELHHFDREKLCRRGLPETPGLSYRIEIDGRVIDEASGSELQGLGRLAPS
jgi:hypothetical protein